MYLFDAEAGGNPISKKSELIIVGRGNGIPHF
jgi:hypothetical protein